MESAIANKLSESDFPTIGYAFPLSQDQFLTLY